MPKYHITPLLLVLNIKKDRTCSISILQSGISCGFSQCVFQPNTHTLRHTQMDTLKFSFNIPGHASQPHRLQSLQLSETYAAGETSRIRLITFHYDNAVLLSPAVGTADCKLGCFQMQSYTQKGPRKENRLGNSLLTQFLLPIKRLNI